MVALDQVESKIKSLQSLKLNHVCLKKIKGSCECEKWEARIQELEFTRERLFEAYDFN